MSRQSRNTVGHRPGRRSRPFRHRNRQTLPSGDRTRNIFTNLMSVTFADGETTIFVLTFDREVTANAVSVPAGTDFQLTCMGETTRTLVSVAQTAPNVVEATMSGALTAAKTYVGTIAAACSAIRPDPAQWADRTASIVVPA